MKSVLSSGNPILFFSLFFPFFVRIYTSRSINVTGLYLFSPFFSRYILVQDLVLFFASISYTRGLRIRFSFLLPFSLVGGHFLLFTSLSALLSVPSVVRSLFAVIFVDLRGSWVRRYPFLLQSAHHFSTQKGKVQVAPT